MSTPRRLAVTLALATALGACHDAGVLEPVTAEFGDDALALLLAAAGEPLAGNAGRDAARGGGRMLFDALAAEIPGFGGLYRAGRCAIVVVLTERDGWDEAIRIVHAAVLPLVADGCTTGLRVEAKAGRFTYYELRRFQHAARPLGGIGGVHGVNIDYSRNSLVIIVSSREAMRQVLAALPRLGIPPAAVAFAAPSARTPTRTG